MGLNAGLPAELRRPIDDERESIVVLITFTDGVIRVDGEPVAHLSVTIFGNVEHYFLELLRPDFHGPGTDQKAILAYQAPRDRMAGTIQRDV